MREKEYCCRAVLNPGYILFVGCPAGLYHVFVKSGETVYSVYGGYKHLGTACNRLLKSANSYKSNEVSYYYMTKARLLERGAF